MSSLTTRAAPVGDDLRSSLARVSARQQRVRLRYGTPAEQGWMNCAHTLADGASFDRWRKRLAGWLHEEYGEAPARTTAGYVLNWYAMVPAYLGALVFHHERRVPSLHPADLSFRLSSPRPHPDAIAVGSAQFACLPTDPACGTDRATVVPDERTLAALLRGRYTAHMARFLDVFAPGARFGRRTLWAAATDALDNAMWHAGRADGDEAAAAADAALLLPGHCAPFTSASTLRRAETADGTDQWTRRREGCCFHYLLAAGNGECATCPRILPKGS